MDRQVRALQAQALVGAVIEHGTWEEEVFAAEPGEAPERMEIEEHSYLYCRFDLVGTAVTRSLPLTGEKREVSALTDGIYDARERALARMEHEAHTRNAEGIVGVTVEVRHHSSGSS